VLTETAARWILILHTALGVAAVGAERAVHERAIARVAEREHTAAYEPSTDDRAKQAAHAAHWFDIKEHWIALGILVSLALNLVLAFWDPRKTGRELVAPVFALAVIVAGSVWLGAIIGVMTATWRAV